MARLRAIKVPGEPDPARKGGAAGAHAKLGELSPRSTREFERRYLAGGASEHASSMSAAA